MPHLFCNQANLFPPYTPPLAGVKAMLSTEEVTSATAHTRQLAISCRAYASTIHPLLFRIEVTMGVYKGSVYPCCC
jgi:hypothetical protein